ncbi:Uma2 family endonuclease [Hymenobacter sp. BT507]|uniref:Uma2 family endonuclease n=1 Tax=Hymenobacter citatus TaxID=2763506 RepID=A0ABR7MEE7_9BACT|nr:Uma2 family endonuclease [Hymenobacter citatus]MBC6609435.1 Uma2 family endonuclease [Hymenobacter citatus]
MPTLPDYTRRYTVEEYFALEEVSDIRHEYYHGEIFPLDGPQAMAGATFAHNTIKQNCVIALRLGLRGKGCRVFDENVRLRINADDHFTYPDVMVTCAEEDQLETRIVQHPTLLIEVLSNSTELRDRSWKLQQYQLLPSLRQYVLISQKRVFVESYLLNERGAWELTMLRQSQEILYFPSLHLRMTVAEVYEEVGLPPLHLAETIS